MDSYNWMLSPSEAPIDAGDDYSDGGLGSPRSSILVIRSGIMLDAICAGPARCSVVDTSIIEANLGNEEATSSTEMVRVATETGFNEFFDVIVEDEVVMAPVTESSSPLPIPGKLMRQPSNRSANSTTADGRTPSDAKTEVPMRKVTRCTTPVLLRRRKTVPPPPPPPPPRPNSNNNSTHHSRPIAILESAPALRYEPTPPHISDRYQDQNEEEADDNEDEDEDDDDIPTVRASRPRTPDLLRLVRNRQASAAPAELSREQPTYSAFTATRCVDVPMVPRVIPQPPAVFPPHPPVEAPSRMDAPTQTEDIPHKGRATQTEDIPRKGQATQTQKARREERRRRNTFPTISLIDHRRRHSESDTDEELKQRHQHLAPPVLSRTASVGSSNTPSLPSLNTIGARKVPLVPRRGVVMPLTRHSFLSVWDLLASNQRLRTH